MLIEIKIFFSVYETAKRLKRQVTNWGEICANYKSEKGLSFENKEFSKQ
jgi:hypothetical protein